MSGRPTMRGAFGAGGEPPSHDPHPGLIAFVRYMARVAAERDYNRLLREGIQPGAEEGAGHD